MFRNPEEVRRRLQELVERFRQKGATSPERAMSIQDLELPPRFEEAMHRRLGRSGIFVEVKGKYYLNEERLKQFQERRARIGSDVTREGSRRGADSPSWSRIVGVLLILPIGLIIAIVLFYFAASGVGFFPGEILIILLIVFIVMTLIRLLFWRSRRRYWRERTGTLGDGLNLQAVLPSKRMNGTR